MPDEAELAVAKVSGETTLRELKFSDLALADAKPRATKFAAPYIAKVTLDTPIAELPFFRGRGCEACQGTGLKGRQGLYETMNMTTGLRKLIMKNVAATEIGAAAVAEGMLTLRMDGWQGHQGHHDARPRREGNEHLVLWRSSATLVLTGTIPTPRGDSTR
ncbi:MAG: hypothetical protein M3Q09_09355 [Gemmatimonadota bacterium]|nr:hypothetical protein [Gemmatimonadota bacterium]